MEVQMHSTCILSSFYTSKLARIAGDSQSQVLFLVFRTVLPSPSFHMSHHFIKYCVSDSLLREPFKPTAAAHLHHSGFRILSQAALASLVMYICFKGIYKGFWACMRMTHRSQMCVHSLQNKETEKKHCLWL